VSGIGQTLGAEPPRLPDGSIRPARRGDDDAVTELLYESAGGLYDRFAGGRKRSLKLLRRAFAREGNNASSEVVTVCELDGAIAGVIAAFPTDEMVARAGAFLRVSLRTLPPWRWARALRVYYAGARSVPRPPGGALYVDALATEPSKRRRGVARALLEDAERLARRRGLPNVALDTALDNAPARALYRSAGFEELDHRPGRASPGFVALVKELR
jgi:ribosomal protein S18 acetylase RimI-like enzyme